LFGVAGFQNLPVELTGLSLAGFGKMSIRLFHDLNSALPFVLRAGNLFNSDVGA
jgi:hypothetical protein